MMKVIPLKSIVPDENQPRKYFAADKMASLSASIKAHGIRNPLVVEEVEPGKFLLTDGERRFRAATELGLKEVPVIVEKTVKDVDRLIVQFNIQEQHEGWTPIEKATAIIRIADEMGISLFDTMKLLGIPSRTAHGYMAFASLVDKDTFTRNEVPIDYAYYINAVKRTAIEKTQIVLEEKFTVSDEKKLENRIVDLIKSGDIRKYGDVIKIKDSFTKSPKLIDKFLGTKMGTVELFKEAKAKGAYHLRNLLNNAMYVRSHGTRFMELRDVEITPAQVLILKEAKRVLKELIGIAD